MEAIEENWRTADLSDRTRAILAFAEKVAGEAAGTREEDLGPLREAGLGDAGILDVVAVVGVFSLFNVIADGLGIEDEPEWAAP